MESVSHSVFAKKYLMWCSSSLEYESVRINIRYIMHACEYVNIHKIWGAWKSEIWEIVHAEAGENAHMHNVRSSWKA